MNEQSQTDLSELAKALSAAQLEMKNPTFDSQNPHFKSKFASLASVRNTVLPVFAKHGLSVVQNLTTTDRGIGCETLLLHSSGQCMRFGPLVLPATKPDAQGFGSAATYARRYALMAVAGVVGDDDDDANAASAPSAERAAYTKKVNEYSSRIIKALDEDRLSAAADLMAEAKDSSEEFMSDVWRTFSTPVKNQLKAIAPKRAA